MATLNARIEEVARTGGAPLVGFAPISRFAEAPRQYHPHTLFPATRTVIAIAIPQVRGTLKAVEDGAYWGAYNCDSYWYLNEVMAPKVLRDIVMLLEEHGYTSLPVHNPFHPHSGRPVRDDQPDGPDGMVSLRIIGCAAGLGELGLSKLLLTPQFGPRQRVFAVFTDAELDPSPLFRGRICDACGACGRECEAGAIGGERTETFTIEGRVFGHASFDPKACSRVHRGEDPRFSPFWNGSEKPGEVPSFNRFCEHRFRHLSVCVGRGCIRACLDHLEKADRIGARFRTPLIGGPRWKLNEPPEPGPRS